MKRTTAPGHAMVLAHLDHADTIAKGFAGQYAGLIERDDAIQVARLALVRIADRIDPEGDPRSYVGTTVRGALRHHLRDRGRLVRVSRREHEKGIWPMTHGSLDATDGDREPLLNRLVSPEADGPEIDSDWLADALDQLPASQAAVLRLRFTEGHSLRQAATELELSHSTVSRIEKAALAVLREQLEGGR